MNTTPPHQPPSLCVVLAASTGIQTADYSTRLADAGFGVVDARNAGEVFEAIHVSVPACILVPFRESPASAVELIRELKSDHAYGHLPLVLILDEAQVPTMAWDEILADDYVLATDSAEKVGARIRLCVERAARELDANPLTGLPGNLTIMREADRRIAKGVPFSMGYIDLDNFKPFNDKYGFSRGDEVLRMTARLVVNAVHDLRNPDTYVGHVGGDDFIFLSPCEVAEAAAEGITKRFDLVVPSFYDEDDRRSKKIVSLDRQGNKREFPLMGCSIAIVDTSASAVRHVGELSARAAEVKKAAKRIEGSSYLVDRRR